MQQNQNPQKKLNEIEQDLIKIQLQSQHNYSIQIGQIIKDTKILILFGFQHEFVDKLYDHFDYKEVLIENDEYIKIVKLQNNSINSYLFNIPYFLDGITNREQSLKQCISKMIIYNLIPSIKNCKFHLVLNLVQIPGKRIQDKLNYISDFGLFEIGLYEIQMEVVSIIVEDTNDLFLFYATSNNIKHDVLKFIHILKEQILKQLLQNIGYQKLKKKGNEEYCHMSSFLADTQEIYTNNIKQILTQFQSQLLLLQQIPNSKDSLEFQNCLQNLLNKLHEVFQQSSIHNLTQMPFLFNDINIILQGLYQEMNKNLQQFNKIKLGQFLSESRVSLNQIELPQKLLDVQQIEFISSVLQMYLKKYFEKSDINQVNTLKINIKYWKTNYQKEIEKILYQFKQITTQIQDGPQEQIEVGVFVFGKSRIGKSTFLNLLRDPNNLKIEEYLLEQRYALINRHQTSFRIDHSCMSETQEISSFQIGNTWYFDCPGFDDNRSEEARIAHRVSLYNHLIKPNKVVGLFLMDISVKDAQAIIDTLDPIYLLLKDKNQLIKDNKNWASLILVKTVHNLKNLYIQEWENIYKGYLEGQYSFYKEMFVNSIEFPRPDKSWQQDEVRQINSDVQQKVFQTISKICQNRLFRLEFQLELDKKLFYLYEIFISMLKIKINQIIEILSNQIDIYIMESIDDLIQKKQQIQRLNNFIKDNINQENLIYILKNILSWSQSNEAFKKISQYLQIIIQDILECFKVEKYFQQNISISPLIIDTQFISQKALKIISIIQNIERWELGLKISFSTGTIIASIISLGGALLAEAALSTVVMGVTARLIAQRVAIGALVTGATGASGTGMTFIVFQYKQAILKEKYESYLREGQ